MRYPKEFFAAVRDELSERGVEASPQTRDMNPIYTGKDVSYIDTKQANRAAEEAVLDAEKFAVFAGLLDERQLSAGRAGQGVGAARLWRTPRRDHRLEIRPGVPRPADRMARRVETQPDHAHTALALLSSAVDSSVVVWKCVGAQAYGYRHGPV